MVSNVYLRSPHRREAFNRAFPSHHRGCYRAATARPRAALSPQSGWAPQTPILPSQLPDAPNPYIPLTAAKTPNCHATLTAARPPCALSRLPMSSQPPKSSHFPHSPPSPYSAPKPSCPSQSSYSCQTPESLGSPKLSQEPGSLSSQSPSQPPKPSHRPPQPLPATHPRCRHDNVRARGPATLGRGGAPENAGTPLQPARAQAESLPHPLRRGLEWDGGTGRKGRKEGGRETCLGEGRRGAGGSAGDPRGTRPVPQ